MVGDGGLKRSALTTLFGVTLLLTAGACSSNSASPSAADSTSTASSDDAGGEVVHTEPAVPDAEADDGRGPLTVRMISASREGAFHSEILKQLLLELGYQVVDVPEAEMFRDEIYELMAHGEADLWANGWFAASPDASYQVDRRFLNSEIDDGTTIGSRVTKIEQPVMAAGGLQGMLVTQSWAEENGVVTLDQINRAPVLWSQLDSDGDGSGEFYGCDRDWTCKYYINTQVLFGGWQQLDPIHRDYDDMFADFMARVTAGKPAVAFAWTPSIHFARAEVGELTMWLSHESLVDDSNPLGIEPGYAAYFDQRPGFSDLEPDVCLGPDSTCQLGFAANSIHITSSTEWLTANPRAHALFREFQVPMEDVSDALLDLETQPDVDVEELANQWIINNRYLADTWIEIALRVRSQSSLD